MMALDSTLAQFLEGEISGRRVTPDVASTIECLSRAGSELAHIISSPAPSGKTQDGLAAGVDNDLQRPLDKLAHGLFEAQLSNSPASVLISEEMKNPRELGGKSSLCIAIDPLHGSANIETNMSIGTIFSIIKIDMSAFADPIEAINSGQMLAAGFLVYGRQTNLILSCGGGVVVFSFNPTTSQFVLVKEDVCIPQGKREFAINASNYRNWDSSVRHFVDDCFSGQDGPLGADYNLRWNASLVAEAYRILILGGLFLYPGDSRPGYQNGRLRFLYEAMPMAFVIEQAGGKAIDGYERILDRKASSLHGRIPLIFGSTDRVDQVGKYFTNDPTENTRFPLFTNRSLLRN
jgi:fructose-1,6-bisphosphatase I